MIASQQTLATGCHRNPIFFRARTGTFKAGNFHWASKLEQRKEREERVGQEPTGTMLVPVREVA